MNFAARKNFTSCLQRFGVSLVGVIACAGSYAQTPKPPAIKIVKPEISEMWMANLPASEKALLAKMPPNFYHFGAATVGQISNVQRFTMEFGEPAKITNITSTPDFKVEPESSCVRGRSYGADTSCVLVVRFTPQGPGHRLGKITVTQDQSADVASLSLLGYSYVPVISFVPATIGTVGPTFSGGVGVINGAKNLAVGGDTLYIADTGNKLIREIDSSGVMRSLASTASAPYGVAQDSFGEVWFTLPGTNQMFEIYDYGPVIQANGSGTDTCHIATPCTLGSENVLTPGEITIDANDNMVFVDGNAGAALSSNVTGSATLVRLYDPFPYQSNPPGAMSIDSQDTLYSAWLGASVCQISAQPLYYAENFLAGYSKVAGGHTCGFSGDGGLADNAEIGNKIGQIAFDTAGNLYFSDTQNNRVRRIDAATGIIRTVAGSGSTGYTGDSGSALKAHVDAPAGIAVDSQGQVYILANTATTGTAQAVRKLSTIGLLAFPSTIQAKASAPLTVIVTNTGNAALTFTSAKITGTNPGEFKIDANTTSCNLVAGSTLAIGQSCQIGVIFTPAAVATYSASLTLFDNTVNFSNVVHLSGSGVAATTTQFSSPLANASVSAGSNVAVTVHVSSSTGVTPTGTVTFKVDGVKIGSAVSLVSGSASKTLTGLTIGSHTVSAYYSGDAHDAASHASETVTVTAVSTK